MPLTRATSIREGIAVDDIHTSTGQPRLSRLSVSARPYKYIGLVDESHDIRLVTILPGRHDEPIYVRINHVHLSDVPDDVPIEINRDLERIRATLPQDWDVSDTWGGRLIYFNQGLEKSSWQHPNTPDFDNETPRYGRNGGDSGVPPFEALSYTWGSPASRKSILIEEPGGTHSRLSVTKNLATALAHLRYPDESRVFWIDAICINQQDISERNAQVGRMSQIYRLARQVVVWLGPGSAQSHLAISTLQYLGQQVEVSGKLGLMASPDAVEREWYEGGCDLPYDQHTWRAISRLFNRSWFGRVWIVQEICLADTRAILQCGHDTISWVLFGQAVTCLLKKHHLPSHTFRNELAGIDGLVGADRAMTYSEMTGAMHDRNCSDPRDRVYGLLGLMSEGFRRRIRPDYLLSVEEVYKGATLAQIEHFGRLDALRECVMTSYPRAITAPSWVPDLLLPPETTLSLRRQFSAGMSCCQIRYAAPDLLEVQGVQAAVIETVHERNNLGFGEGLSDASDWSPSNAEHSYVGGGTVSDAFALTICGFKVSERFRESWAILPSLEEWKRYLRGDIYRDLDDAREAGNINLSYLTSVERLLFQRTFFHTREGYIGLGPLEMLPGKSTYLYVDRLCLVWK